MEKINIMPTIGHLFIGIIISISFYYISYKKFTFLMGIIFIMGSVLPDTFTILRMLFFPDNRIFNAPHGVIAWILWAFIFAVILKIFIFCLIKKNKKNSMKFSHIYLILLSAGWIHLGLDMLTDPVRLFWKYNISSSSFYTPYEIIIGEQDVITFFYAFFIVIPFMMLFLITNKNVIKKKAKLIIVRNSKRKKKIIEELITKHR